MKGEPLGKLARQLRGLDDRTIRQAVLWLETFTQITRTRGDTLNLKVKKSRQVPALLDEGRRIPYWKMDPELGLVETLAGSVPVGLFVRRHQALPPAEGALPSSSAEPQFHAKQLSVALNRFLRDPSIEKKVRLYELIEAYADAMRSKNPRHAALQGGAPGLKSQR